MILSSKHVSCVASIVIVISTMYAVAPTNSQESNVTNLAHLYYIKGEHSSVKVKIQDEDTIFLDPKFNISFSGPRNWFITYQPINRIGIREKRESGHTLAKIVQYENHPKNRLNPGVSISVSAKSSYATYVKNALEWIKYNMEAVEKQSDYFKLYEEPQEVVLNNKTFARASYAYSSYGLHIKMIVCSHVFDELSLTIYAIDLEENFEENQENFQDIINSISLQESGA